MDTLRSFIHCTALQIHAAVKEFQRMNWVQRVRLLRKGIREHVWASAITGGLIIVISGCIILPPQGRIITMGPEMRDALSLLGSTSAGRTVIRKAQRSTRGSPIFLTLGSTEKDGLVDNHGEVVIGVTRAFFKNIVNSYLPNGIFICSNKDVVDSRIDLIALNIAFELENVVYAMKNAGVEFAGDSPRAWQTVVRVAKELRLTE